jgi:hypothetical protein
MGDFEVKMRIHNVLLENVLRDMYTLSRHYIHHISYNKIYEKLSDVESEVRQQTYNDVTSSLEKQMKS